ncbi:hypothetical protein [Iningainema tapete]|uniref:Uncharacterized protein n=1 Tax=Iningainema tapete BLCC-T55 TaxID=2748662 RepID=A0A8J7C5Z9_9CYAN|nr:hypothetical protein [Iningainema tapete]MBD2771391.1 hypothetical protein [Iningainema tapete BLCC-T55]
MDEVADRLRRIAKIIKHEWNNFPPQNREQLKELAYTLIEPPKGLQNFRRKIWAALYLMVIRATNQRDAFDSCVEALNNWRYTR